MTLLLQVSANYTCKPQTHVAGMLDETKVSCLVSCKFSIWHWLLSCMCMPQVPGALSRSDGVLHYPTLHVGWDFFNIWLGASTKFSQLSGIKYWNAKREPGCLRCMGLCTKAWSITADLLLHMEGVRTAGEFTGGQFVCSSDTRQLQRSTAQPDKLLLSLRHLSRVSQNRT